MVTKIDGTYEVIIDNDNGNSIQFFIKNGFIYMGNDPVTIEVVRIVGNFISII